MRRGTKRRAPRSAWLLGLALLCAHDARAAAPRSTLDDDAVLRAFEEHVDAGDLRRRLVPLATDSLPLLFRIAVAGRLPASSDDIPPPLGAEDRAVVREVLTILPRRALTGFLEGLAAVEQTPPTRLEAQRLLAAVGGADHLRLLARLTAAPRDRRLSPPLRTGFGRTLEAILARDPLAYPRLHTLLRDVSPTLTGTIVQAMAGDPAGEATGRLADLLGFSPELDPLLLTCIAGRGSVDWLREGDVRDRVRRYLLQRDPILVCSAARAAGRLRDDEAVPALIDLLAHAEVRVREACRDGLREITGLGLGTGLEEWQRWYAREQSWWDTVADSVLLRVEREEGVDFVRAAGELAEHRLYRERAVEGLVLALDRRDPGEVRLVCQLLGNLGSPLAVPALEECLRHDDSRVRRAAADGLARLGAATRQRESDSEVGR